MGKTGYKKCVELLQHLVSKGVTSMTEDELKKEIAKNIGFSKDHNTITNSFNALLVFELIKFDGDKFVINKENLNA